MNDSEGSDRTLSTDVTMLEEMVRSLGGTIKQQLDALRSHFDLRFNQLDEKVNILTDQQAQVDADVQAGNAALALIEQEITDLKAQIAANPGQPASQLDLTGLDALANRLKGDEPVAPAPTPTPAPPTPNPNPPVAAEPPPPPAQATEGGHVEG